MAPTPDSIRPSHNGPPPPGKTNFAASIASPAAVKAELLHQFKNGKPVGSTTHWGEWDNHFKWKPGELTVITGHNNAGKSEAAYQWMLTKSVFDGWKWDIYSPENEPVGEVYDQLAHTLVGQSTNPAWGNCMSAERYERSLDWLFQHFFVIDSDKLPDVPSPDVLFEYFTYMKKQNGTQGCFFDPWNQAFHDMQGLGEVQYLSNELTKAKRFARLNQQCLFLSAHPVKPQTDNGKTWRCPTQFDLSGGAMWGNKADNVLAIHRPNYLQDKSDTSVEWHAHKIKKQKLVGRPGWLSLNFDYLKNRYYLNGVCPLDGPEATRIFDPDLLKNPAKPPASTYRPGTFPTSNFEEAPY